MKKIKYLSVIVITSTTFLFSGCVYTSDTFYNDSYEEGCNRPSINVSLIAYDYPYYYDRPYYFFNGFYYYGGFFHDGFYYYGDRRFRHGHYYNRGYRYYNGRRYRAKNGRYGYYANRDYYERAHHHRKLYRQNERRFDRDREYRFKEQTGRDSYYKRPREGARQSMHQYMQKGNIHRSHRHSNGVVRRTVRKRPAR